MSKISVTTIAGLTSGGDANKVKIEDGDTLEVVNGSQTINRTGDGDLIAFQKGGADSGSISIESSGTAFDGESGHAGLKMFLGSVASRQNGADVDNLIDLGWTGGRFKDIYIGGGLYVGGTGSANKFDDYEEGTWTPGINYAGNNTNATMNQSSGTYVKLGRQVFCSFMLYIGNKNGGTGDVFLTGLPFTAVDLISNTSIEGNGIISYYYGLSASVHTQSIAVIQGGTTAEIYTGASGTNSTRATVSHYDNNAQIRGSFTYHA